MPGRKKQPGTQQGHRRSTGLTVVAGDARPIPPPPTVEGGLLASSKAAWSTFWSSLPAQATEDVDITVAERWIVSLDEWRRSLNAIRRSRVVEGSTGQPVLNPLAAWVASREAEMARCERQLGIGPKCRVDLGISFGQARFTAAELNAATAENQDGDVDPAEVEPPAVIRGSRTSP